MRLKTNNIIMIVLFIFGGIYLLHANYPNLFDSITGSIVRGDYVTVDLYVMSQCPYGVQAEQSFKSVMDQLGKYIDLNIEYIGRASGNSFDSLHGQSEINGDIVQLCAKKIDFEKYYDFILCQNSDYSNLVNSIDSCAAEVGLDAQMIKDCFEGDQGKALLKESFQKAEQLQVGGSPTIYIGGIEHQGQRDSSSLTKAICRWLDVKECADIPVCDSDFDCNLEPGMIGKCSNPGTKESVCSYTEPEEVKLIIVNDKNCAACDSSKLETVLQQIFLGTIIEQVDANSEEGQNLITSMNVKYLPAYFYEKKITENPIFSNPQLSSAFEEKGEYMKILDEATGATHLIDKEEIAKLQKALNIGEKPQIDFFVMSYCPYGNIAEEAISQVYDLLGDKVKYVPHYVIYSNYAGGGQSYCLDSANKYCSMHGIQELNQDIREICVYEQSGINKYFEFVKAMNAKCNANNADACWSNVAKGLNLDIAKIALCEKDKGIEYSAKELGLNSLLSVRGSPTTFINGVQYNGARDATGYQTALCEQFETAPEECNELIASQSTTVPAGSCS